MALEQRLIQKQVQKLIMTQKMQQSMHILQLPILELNQIIAEEIAENPVLEESQPVENTDETQSESTPKEEVEPDIPATVDQKIIQDKNTSKLELDWLNNDNIWSSEFSDKNTASMATQKHDFQQSLITKASSLQDELTKQFHLANTTEKEWAIAEHIIWNIDDNGYLKISLDEIAKTTGQTVEVIEQVLSLVQALEPAGVGSRTLKESLLIQLMRLGKETSPESLIVNQFLNELAAKKFKVISKGLKISLEKIKKYAESISHLDPKPCRNFAPETLRIIPDILLEKNPEGFDITINTKSLPQFAISKMYQNMIKKSDCPEKTLEFIKEKIKNAQNLIDGISQRHQTLEKVTKYIINYQKDCLDQGIDNIRPLTLKTVAEKLDVHPSTISRTVANKFIQTPYGTFALKNFFSQSIATEDGELSNQTVKTTIDELVKRESPTSPLSDQEIVTALKTKGMCISRRTVTKYRNALKIPASHLRRRDA